MKPNNVFVFDDLKQLSLECVEKIAQISKEAISQRQRFSLAISGGSLPSLLVEGLKQHKDLQFDKWHLFYADERIVPLTDPESNHQLVHEKLLQPKVLPIPAGQIHTIKYELQKPDLIAAQYEEQLKQHFQNDVIFDLILLGMGPDGHTASLFPSHPLLEEKQKKIAYLVDSPKPPPQRVTMTYPVLEQSRYLIMVVTGEGKKEVLKQVFNNGNVPISRFSKGSHRLWYLDTAAASLL